MSLLQKQLRIAKEQEKLLSFIEYGSDTNFFCGYVLDYTSEMVTIKHITKFGKDDGLIVQPLDAFVRIDFDDDYASLMEYLIKNSDKIYTKSNYKIDFSDENYYTNIFNFFCGNRDVILSFEIDNDFFSGYLIEFSESDFILHAIGKEGEDLGMSIFRIEDITSIQIDDVDNRRRNLLFKWRMDKVF
ncbi:hypothetical protein [Flavobacterium sp. I3-2]|uniref:hypothetical protein n=1 Tax=Flavobacterium sp. I3-2 TaxID=2748319 RepID=UPI0015ADDA10|nr:hypothetical protein [Flavobacterium sp. I3-2]